MNALPDKGALSAFDQGFEAALGHCAPITERLDCLLFDALGGVLGEDLICTRPLPPFDNSAMDGYGVRLDDAGCAVAVVATFLAGDEVLGFTLGPKNACKVMTGSVIPAGVEAVVPFEKARFHDGRVVLPKKIRPLEHIRPKGEEVKEGQKLLEAGTLIGPSELALLASQGRKEVTLLRPLRAAVLATGSEIVEPWQSAKAHQVHNSNGAALYGILKTLGAEVTYLGALHDSPQALKNAIGQMEGFDLIVTSGGVSTGEADFTDQVFRQAGLKVVVQSMALKPGKNMMIGTLGKTVVISLPGNPQAAMTLMMLVGGSIVAKKQGRRAFYPATGLAQMGETLKLKPDRANIILGTLHNGLFVSTDGFCYGSGMLTPLARSNGFVVALAGFKKLNKGQSVPVVTPLSFSTQSCFFAHKAT